MLELNYDQKLMDDLWAATSAKVELSEPFKRKFMELQGPAPTYFDNRRTYHRYYMRGKAVLQRGNSAIGTYTKDISRQGIAFLSPVALLPKERVKLRVATKELSLEVTRCRRLEANCFECGAKFAL
jgi:hypothetical protein